MVTKSLCRLSNRNNLAILIPYMKIRVELLDSDSEVVIFSPGVVVCLFVCVSVCVCSRCLSIDIN